MFTNYYVHIEEKSSWETKHGSRYLFRMKITNQIFTNGRSVLTNNMRKNGHECVHMDEACAQTMQECVRMEGTWSQTRNVFIWREYVHKLEMCSHWGNMSTNQECQFIWKEHRNQECVHMEGTSCSRTRNLFSWRNVFTKIMQHYRHMAIIAGEVL